MTKRQRRPNGQGCLRKRPNGSWQVSFMTGYYPDGRKIIKYISAPTQAEVLKKMNDFIKDRDDGLDIYREITVKEWVPIYLENHRGSIKAATYISYTYTMRHIVRLLGDKKINELRPIDVDAALRELRAEGRSDSAISQVRGLLYMICQSAVRNGLCRNNVVQYAEKSKRQFSKREKEVYSADEVARLMRELPHDRIGNSIRLMLGSGLRTQELLALKPEHIAQDGSSVTVEQAVSMVRGTVTLSSPKSFDSIRKIPLPQVVRPYVIELRQTKCDFIWAGKRPDVPANPSTFRTAYRRAIESIPGLRYISPHGLRHTYVTTLQSQGVSVETIRSLVGHSTALMTTHYLHVQDPVREAAVESLSVVLSGDEYASGTAN